MRAHEHVLVGQAHEHMLMGQVHEHVFVRQSPEHVFVGQAHEHEHVLVGQARIICSWGKPSSWDQAIAKMKIRIKASPL